MRIGIDARFYGPEEKGLGRYTEQLVQHLIALDRETTFVLFIRRQPSTPIPRVPNLETVLANFRWYTLAEQLWFPAVLRRAHLDLVHFPHFNVPVSFRRPFIVTIHDLILTKYPTIRASTLGPARYWFKHAAYELVIRSAVRRAEKVITVSEFSKRDLIEHFGLAPDKVLVTPEAAEPVRSDRSPREDAEILRSYEVNQPYLLYVGNAHPHKNLERLLDAFDKLRSEFANLRLVLVGREDEFFRRLRRRASTLGLEGWVVFPGFVPDRDLPAFYRNAQLYVFPSLYEGFGLPPLEAMRYGVPVAAANRAALPEVLGNAAAFFNPEEVDDMIRVIRRLLRNEKLRVELRERGRAQVERYRWEDLARQTLAAYRSVLHQP